jgi:hypothetical protein
MFFRYLNAVCIPQPVNVVKSFALIMAVSFGKVVSYFIILDFLAVRVFFCVDKKKPRLNKIVVQNSIKKGIATDGNTNDGFNRTYLFLLI